MRRRGQMVPPPRREPAVGAPPAVARAGDAARRWRAVLPDRGGAGPRRASALARAAARISPISRSIVASCSRSARSTAARSARRTSAIATRLAAPCVRRIARCRVRTATGATKHQSKRRTSGSINATPACTWASRFGSGAHAQGIRRPRIDAQDFQPEPQLAEPHRAGMAVDAEEAPGHQVTDSVRAVVAPARATARARPISGTRPISTAGSSTVTTRRIAPRSSASGSSSDCSTAGSLRPSLGARWHVSACRRIASTNAGGVEEGATVQRALPDPSRLRRRAAPGAPA